MNTSPLKIEQGMQRQIALWRESVASQGRRLGWKIGFNMATDQQRLNLPSAMVGFLSRDQRLPPGARYQPPAGARLLVEPEVALLIGCDVEANTSAAAAQAAIAGYCAALELVDTTRSVNDDMEEILAGNLFHDRVLLTEPLLTAAAFKRDELSLTLRISNEEVRSLEQQRVPQDFTALICTVAHTLASQGEQLRKGDWIISGAAATPVPVKAGDMITLEMGALGRTTLSII